jgi:hypothetical protein
VVPGQKAKRRQPPVHACNQFLDRDLLGLATSTRFVMHGCTRLAVKLDFISGLLLKATETTSCESKWRLVSRMGGVTAGTTTSAVTYVASVKSWIAILHMHLGVVVRTVVRIARG